MPIARSNPSRSSLSTCDPKALRSWERSCERWAGWGWGDPALAFFDKDAAEETELWSEEWIGATRVHPSPVSIAKRVPGDELKSGNSLLPPRAMTYAAFPVRKVSRRSFSMLSKLTAQVER
jgi:hypothetical protein